MEKIFTQIYHQNVWGNSESVSGSASALSQTKKIIEELPILIQKIGAKSFLDISCGDFNWMKEVELCVDSYIGADIVEELIERNNQKFADRNRNFIRLDITKDDLPEVDIIFCRDCLVHLSFGEILRAIENFRKSNSKYLLTTTFTNQQRNINMITGGWRPLNLQRPPFDFPEPIHIINENCTIRSGKYSDKSLGLWRIVDINP